MWQAFKRDYINHVFMHVMKKFHVRTSYTSIDDSHKTPICSTTVQYSDESERYPGIVARSRTCTVCIRSKIKKGTHVAFTTIRQAAFAISEHERVENC